MEPANERAKESSAPQDSGNTEQTRVRYSEPGGDSHRDAAVTDEEEEGDALEEARVEVGESSVTVDQSRAQSKRWWREGERDDLCGAS
ncbi:hypothetical protein MTO96_000563 [Rhipicephalus appendiculatus]